MENEVQEAVAALETGEQVEAEAKPVADTPAVSDRASVVRAEAAALRARLRAERESRQRQAQAQATPASTPTQPAQRETEVDDDPLVRVVRDAIAQQQQPAAKQLDEQSIAQVIERVVSERLMTHEEQQRRRASELAVAAHLETAGEQLPLLSAFAVDRLQDVYDVLVDEYAEEYRASGRKLSVSEAASRVEKKLASAIERLSKLTQARTPEPAPAPAKAKPSAAAVDDDEAALRDAVAALVSREGKGA